jgi:DNA-binding transcriptional MerR regulator
MPYLTVKQLAQASGVTVRTLHHYDEIGLLRPNRRTESGYRLYGPDEALRLQQILILRELGMPLEVVRSSLEDSAAGQESSLRHHKVELMKRKERLEGMLRSVDLALDLITSKRGEIEMSNLFEGFQPEEHQAEAEQRWGDTEAWRTSNERTSKYSASQWQEIKAQQNALYAKAGDLMNQGLSPTQLEAMDVAEAMRAHIERWFYPCSPAMHVSLADMYGADQRFAKNIDKFGDGLTRWLVQAIKANASR